jgi:Methyltransferase domain
MRSIISKINWVFTGLSLALLKRSLHKRISAADASFLQQLPVKNTTVYNRVDFITAACANKKVLHVGFTDHPFTAQRIADGTLLHLQLKKVTAGLCGVDLEQTAVAQYTALTGDANVCCGDITVQYPAAVIAFDPQLILLGEVLEHVKDPHRAADILYNSFNEGTRLLVTVPNYLALDNLAAALHTTEAVHPHHYWYFSPYTLCRVFDKALFTLEELHFGMYYQPAKKINSVLRAYPFYGDCIMAVFSINKKTA